MSVSGGLAVGLGLLFQFLGLAFGFLFRVVDGRVVLATAQGDSVFHVLLKWLKKFIGLGLDVLDHFC